MPDKPSLPLLEKDDKIPFLKEKFIKPEDMGYPVKPEKFQMDFDFMDKHHAPPDKDLEKYKPKQNGKKEPPEPEFPKPPCDDNEQ
jgi:hypothetical protein